MLATASVGIARRELGERTVGRLVTCRFNPEAGYALLQMHSHHPGMMNPGSTSCLLMPLQNICGDPSLVVPGVGSSVNYLVQMSHFCLNFRIWIHLVVTGEI